MNTFKYKALVAALLQVACVFGLVGESKLSAVTQTTSAQRIVPIVFHKDYDISFFGIENLHPFDTKKYGKIAQRLEKTFGILPNEYQKPQAVTDAQLQEVHTTRYLEALKSSSTVAAIAEVAPLRFLPNFLLQRNMLNSMRLATGGTILAAQLAMEHGWAINLGGGYHHAKADGGEGFCFFADIPLAIKKLRETHPSLKVLVVDLDAHQGNGLEAILGPDPLTYIFDMYSKYNYPSDQAVRQYIDFDYPLATNIQDQEYLSILKNQLPKAIAATQPDLIIYNAGSDIFELDPLGRMRVTKEGIIERDSYMFSQALENRTPILMVLSGGYSAESAEIVGTSIETFIKKFNLVETRPQMAVNQEAIRTSKLSKISKK